MAGGGKIAYLSSIAKIDLRLFFPGDLYERFGIGADFNILCL